MRRALGALGAAALLAACGGSPDPADLDLAAWWENDTITVDVNTALPDGAVISWGVFSDVDEEDPDAPHESGQAEISDGEVTVEVDASDFQGDRAYVEAAYLADYQGQPDGVPDQTETREMVIERRD